MNLTGFWLGADRIGFDIVRTLVGFLWQSSLLLASAMAIACLLRRQRAATRHALVAVALVATPFLPLVTMLVSRAGVPLASVSVLPAYTPPATLASAAPEVHSALLEPAQAESMKSPDAAEVGRGALAMPGRGSRTLARTEIRPAVRRPAGNTSADVPGQGTLSPIVARTSGTPERSEGASAFSPLSFPWACIAAVYAAGVAWCLAWIALGCSRIRQWVRSARPVTEPRVLAVFREARRRLGVRREFLVVESERVPAPLAFGSFHPRVILPQGLASRLSDAELHAVALHETAHIARGDTWILGFVSLLRAVFFFHPLVWLASRQVALFAEQAADDAVLEATGEPVGYAEMLARMAEALPARTPGIEAAVGFSLRKSTFLQRVEAILARRGRVIRRASRIALVVSVVGLLVSVALAAGLPLGEKEHKSPMPAVAQKAEPAVPKMPEGTSTKPEFLGGGGGGAGIPDAEDPRQEETPARDNRARHRQYVVRKGALQVVDEFRDSLAGSRFQDAAGLLDEDWVDIWGMSPAGALQYLQLYVLVHRAAQGERLDGTELAALESLLDMDGRYDVLGTRVAGSVAYVASRRTTDINPNPEKALFPAYRNRFYLLRKTDAGWRITSILSRILARNAFLQGKGYDDTEAHATSAANQFILDLYAGRFDDARARMVPSNMPLVGLTNRDRAEIRAIESAKPGERLSSLDERSGTNLAHLLPMTSGGQPSAAVYGNRARVSYGRSVICLTLVDDRWRVVVVQSNLLPPFIRGWFGTGFPLQLARPSPPQLRPPHMSESEEKARLFRRSLIDLDARLGSGEEFPEVAELGYDAETGNLVLNPEDESLRLLPLTATEGPDQAVAEVRNNPSMLANSDLRELSVSETNFLAVWTSDDNLAVGQIRRPEGPRGPEIFWWLTDLPEGLVKPPEPAAPTQVPASITPPQPPGASVPATAPQGP